MIINYGLLCVTVLVFNITLFVLLYYQDKISYREFYVSLIILGIAIASVMALILYGFIGLIVVLGTVFSIWMFVFIVFSVANEFYAFFKQWK